MIIPTTATAAPANPTAKLEAPPVGGTVTTGISLVVEREATVSGDGVGSSEVTGSEDVTGSAVETVVAGSEDGTGSEDTAEDGAESSSFLRMILNGMASAGAVSLNCKTAKEVLE